MRIAIIGTGYVGLVTGTCLAEHGHTVTCVDKVKDKIDALNRGELPIYEPGLKELLDRNAASGRLFFTVDGPGAVEASDIVFIAVGTPPGPNGEADLTHVKEAAAMIGRSMRGYRVVVNKSTVPVGTTDLVAGILAEHTPYPFDVVSNPEFLREGAAVEDCMNPDRIVIGAYTDRAKAIMMELYRTFDAPIVLTDPRSAELIKYASNAFLAVKISFINEMAQLCDRLGADVIEVARGMGLDPRIGSAFLKAGIGYGGSCFPKDMQALLYTASRVECELPIVEAATRVNAEQRRTVVRELGRALGGLEGRVVGILGLAFKPNTDDVREAPALDIIQQAVSQGAVIRAYDPKAMKNAARALTDMGLNLETQVLLCENPLEAAAGCDALVLATEWPEFATLPWERVCGVMRGRLVLDGRNLLDSNAMRKLGFQYRGIGRGGANVAVESLSGAVSAIKR